MDIVNATPAGQRRQVLEAVRSARESLARMRDRWNVRGTVYERHTLSRPDGTTFVNAETRDRQPEEYPENQAGSWARLYADLGEVINELAELRVQAAVRYRKLTAPDA